MKPTLARQTTVFCSFVRCITAQTHKRDLVHEPKTRIFFFSISYCWIGWFDTAERTAGPEHSRAEPFRQEVWSWFSFYNPLDVTATHTASNGKADFFLFFLIVELGRTERTCAFWWRKRLTLFSFHTQWYFETLLGLLSQFVTHNYLGCRAISLRWHEPIQQSRPTSKLQRSEKHQFPP